ncbi:MFS transporter [Phycicoccus sp. Soil748]|uniref:MFS transporter n=1 Tax=Phycicoccus sp. Soil748 TaxID=1736397 RepID=UPI0007032119|nr:MFS transporter [Phycicoccus sp. Soil748]KRE56990.1 transporter [Phycicoccus sp. Soil748]
MADQTPVRDLLRERQFALLVSARTLSMLAVAFAPVALAFGILDLPGATPTTLSTVLAAESIAVVLFILVGGVVADRYPRHRVLQVAEWVNALAHAALAVMVGTEHAPLWGLAAAAVVSGTATATVWPALTGIVPEVVPPEHLQQGNAVLALGTNIARVAGLVAGGIVVAGVGGGWALAIASASFACSGLLVALMRLPARPALVAAARSGASGSGAPEGAVSGKAGSNSALADLRDGWDEFRSRQWLWVVVVQFSVLVMVFQAAHLVLGPVVAREELGGPTAWTAVLTGEAVGLIVGVLVAMRLRPRRPILLGVLLTLGAAPPYLLLGASAPLWVVVASAFVLGLCFDLFGILWQTTMQRVVPPAALSRVSSYDAMGSMLLGPLGLVLAGPAAEHVGAHRALVVCGVVMVVTTLGALASPGVRNLVAPGPAAVALPVGNPEVDPVAPLP